MYSGHMGLAHPPPPPPKKNKLHTHQKTPNKQKQEKKNKHKTAKYGQRSRGSRENYSEHNYIFALVKIFLLISDGFFVLCVKLMSLTINIHLFIHVTLSRENFFRCWICCWHSQSWIPYKMKYYRGSNVWLYKRGSSAPYTCVS